jgi:Family of unknown function (DUF6311)
LSDSRRDLLGALAALALGAVAFFLLFGWPPLIPTNIAFLDHADRAMHTLGWEFFRDTPWGVPPGASPRLGIELGSSIALVDGLPLFAIPLKLVGQWLPHPFQYWGYWWLLCLLLQSLFAYLFARSLGAGRLVALLAAGFAVITPAFVFRLTLHMALAGHWVILAALWLYAKRTPPRLFAWPLLLAVTAAIHAYLLAMVMALWVAAYLQRLWLRRFTWASASELLVAPLAVTIVLWTVGFFYTGSVDSYGFGFYRLNVLWPIISYGNWSHIFPDLPHGEYDYEGLSFLGIGIFAILALAIVTGAVFRLRRMFSPRWVPLIATAIFLAVCALSNRVGVLDHQVLDIPIDGIAKFLGETFRSSGRFVWPLLYILTIGAVVLLGRRLPTTWAVGIMAICLAAQIVDSERGLSFFANTDPPAADHWSNRLDSPFWQRAEDAGYNRIRAIPVVYKNPDWRELEQAAYLHHFDVDAIYLGRVDDRALKSLQDQAELGLATGSLEPRTLYVVDVPTALRLYPLLKPGDLLADIDHRIVFARGGASLIDGLDITPDLGMSR